MSNQTMNWQQALDRLVKGNERFVSGLRSADALLGHVKLKELAAKGQAPFAVMLTCSDSRVPAELLFDCGFGELFVVRVAGNVVQPSQIASIEYAAKVLGSPLCVVMGHSKCGAVHAALETVTGNKPELGPHIDFLIELIRPAVQRCVDNADEHGEALLAQCIRENVKDTAHEILENSTILRSLTAENRFRVVEAVFKLETGEVEFGPVEGGMSHEDEAKRRASAY